MTMPVWPAKRKVPLKGQGHELGCPVHPPCYYGDPLPGCGLREVRLRVLECIDGPMVVLPPSPIEDIQEFTGSRAVILAHLAYSNWDSLLAKPGTQASVSQSGPFCQTGACLQLAALPGRPLGTAPPAWSLTNNQWTAG